MIQYSWAKEHSDQTLGQLDSIYESWFSKWRHLNSVSWASWVKTDYFQSVKSSTQPPQIHTKSTFSAQMSARWTLRLFPCLTGPLVGAKTPTQSHRNSIKWEYHAVLCQLLSKVNQPNDNFDVQLLVHLKQQHWPTVTNTKRWIKCWTVLKLSYSLPFLYPSISSSTWEHWECDRSKCSDF